MKRSFLLVTVLLIPLIANSQFNQKISINLSAGIFKTFGEKYSESFGAFQMPNYLTGFAGNAGFQFKLGNHFAMLADFGALLTGRWNYSTPDKENYLSWTVNDPVTDEVLEEGEDYLDLHNWAVIVKPKLYLLGDKKWNPYFFTGISLNWTRCWFENNLWYAMKKWGQIAPEETEPWNDNLEENFGIGFNPGLGMEFSPGKMMHFYVETGYYFISLKEENFKDPARVENFNSFVLQAGIRINFIKSKDL